MAANGASRAALRVFAATLGGTAALIFSAGVYSLATGDSLASRLAGRRLGTVVEPPSVREPAQARPSPADGPWAIDPDPDVGMTMRPNAVREIVGATTTTDDWGQRVRLGPRPVKGTRRIVVLGDSVAFGYGVADDQTFAHHLETYLAAVVSDAPAPAVFTVACPGWNTRNQVRYLLDHLRRLRPDIVILMPVENDLDDQYRINQEGLRGLAFDPALAPDRPHVCGEHWARLYALTADDTPAAESLRRAVHGDIRNSLRYIAESGLSPESVRRWREVGDRLVELAERLEQYGARLMVALRSENAFETQFDALVREHLPAVPTRTFFAEYLPEDALPTDGHPDPRYTRAGAWCLADELLARSWIPGASAEALEPIGPRYAERVVERRSDAELAEALGDMRSVWREFLGPAIDLDFGRGFHQVYGGVEAEGAVGRHVWFGLDAGGDSRRLVLRIRRLSAASRVYPLVLRASFNGVPGAALPVPPPEPGAEAFELSFEVPDAVRDDDLIDVRVDSSNWTVLTTPPPFVDEPGPLIGLVAQRRTAPVSYYFRGAALAR